MDQRTAELDLLRQAKEKLGQIETLKSKIKDQKSRITQLQKDAAKPGCYEKLPTNTEAETHLACFREASRKADRQGLLIFIICMLLNAALFAFSIIWLLHASNTVWFDANGDRTAFLVCHCIAGAILILLPVYLKFFKD